MKEPIKFNLQSLLTLKDGRVSGPMSPVLLAKEMAKSAGFKYNRLARVSFSDERINQRREDGGLTGFDTLVIGAVFPNGLWLSLWVDKGIGALPVAMTFQPKPVTKVTAVYEKAHFARKLTVTEINEVFDSIFINPEQINIINNI